MKKGKVWWAPGCDSHSKNQLWLEVWSFQPHPLFSGKDGETRDGVSGQSWPCDEATVKIPNVHVVWNLPAWRHVEVLGERCARERAWISSHSLTLHLFYLVFTSIQLHVLLQQTSKCNCFQILWAIWPNYWTQTGGRGYSHLQLVGQKYRWRRVTWDRHLKLAAWHDESCGDWALNLWELMLSPGRYWICMYRVSSWCRREFLDGREKPQHLVTKSVSIAVPCE